MNRTIVAFMTLAALSLLSLVARAQESSAAGDFDLPAGATIYHVATTGANANPGTSRRPFRTVQRAVDAVKAGDLILVHAGTYHGAVEIKTTGTPSRTIRLRSAGDGPAVLTASFRSPKCNSGSPTRERTIQILNGADHWTISDLTVVNGILVAGKRSMTLDDKTHNRNLPGRAVYDRAAAVKLLPKLGVDPSDDIRIVRNKVLRRGIQIIASRWVHVVDNEVSLIECGTGAGIHLSRFSDFGVVRGNFVHHNSPSLHHPMEEGIRLGSQTNYSLVEGNLVSDMVGRGRGFSTDVLSSWNVIKNNTARRTAIGFNEQHGGWGNQWYNNRAKSVREVGFKVDGKDNNLTVPNDGVPAYVVFRNNCSVGNPTDLGIGAIQASTFDKNSFAKFNLSKNVLGYWKAAKNLYDGSRNPPSEPGSTKVWCN